MAPISEEKIEKFRQMMKEVYDVEMDFAQAKGKYLKFLGLFWILAHRAPKEGEHFEPPTPPWL